MRGGVEMQNAAPMMLDDEKAVQHTETQRGHGEEVEGGDHLAMVLEECQPALHLRLVRLALQPLPIARDTVGSETSNPSCSSSPWMRGAPQDGFSDFMRRINS